MISNDQKFHEASVNVISLVTTYQLSELKDEFREWQFSQFAVILREIAKVTGLDVYVNLRFIPEVKNDSLKC